MTLTVPSTILTLPRALVQAIGEKLLPLHHHRRTMNGGTANVYLALPNFIQEWFPEETKELARRNEKEAAEETMRELGWEGKHCLIM